MNLPEFPQKGVVNMPLKNISEHFPEWYRERHPSDIWNKFFPRKGTIKMDELQQIIEESKQKNFPARNVDGNIIWSEKMEWLGIHVISTLSTMIQESVTAEFDFEFYPNSDNVKNYHEAIKKLVDEIGKIEHQRDFLLSYIEDISLSQISSERENNSPEKE